MAWQIKRVDPKYDWNTDAQIGSEVTWASHTYETPRLAAKIAGRLRQEDEENYGDAYFVVVKAGHSAFDDKARWMPDRRNDAGDGWEDEVPF